MVDSAPTIDSATGVLPRPQPVGVFPLPAGYLLIGPGPDGDTGADLHDAARRALLSGKRPGDMPDSLAYYRHALDADLDAALAAITGDSTIDELNRFVLDPTAARLAALDTMLDSEADAALRSHFEMIAFVVGMRLDPPDPGSTDGEFAAMAHSAQATLALERHDTALAIDRLEAAAQAAHRVSAPMSGQLLGQLANVQLDEGGAKRAAVTFEAALDALADTDLDLNRAELHVAAGAMFQEMSEAAPRLLQQAINHYHQALALVNSQTAPETHAIANANLGLAYITMPMNEASDQLRIGVAVQSMREALNYFTPDNHPDRWSSTQLNLANALVYMPSKHQADNIAEAVGLYEGVLQHRDRESDPQGRARVLANQGNALAHLGVFDDAKAKLHESRAIFEEFEEESAVMMVRSVLDEIAKQESLIRQDS